MYVTYTCMPHIHVCHIYMYVTYICMSPKEYQRAINNLELIKFHVLFVHVSCFCGGIWYVNS